MWRRSTTAGAIALLGGAALVAGVLAPVTATAAPTVSPRSGAYTYGNWSTVGLGLSSTVYSIGMSNSTMVAAGVFRQSGPSITVNRVAALSGSTWGTLGAADTGIDPTVATASNSNLVYPGAFGLDIARDDSSATDDTVYVGGYFTNVTNNSSNVAANNVAMWNGFAWQAMGDGLGVQSLATGSVVQDVIVGNDPSNSFDTNFADDTIFAVGGIAGACTSSSSCPSSSNLGVMQWSPSSNTWTTMPGSAIFNSQPLTGVYLDDSTATSDTLVVAGTFQTINSVTGFNRIAAWSYATNSWQPMGNGFNNDVNGVTVHPVTGDVYAVGKFTLLCSNAACTATTEVSDGVARWDRGDQQWYSVGTGLGGTINLDDIGFSPDGNVAYVVGFGGTAGGTQINGIATITGANFNSATTDVSGTWGYIKSSGNIGVTGNARSVIVNNDGSVYVAGGFTQAGAINAQNVALFTPGPEPDPNIPAIPPGAPTNVVAKGGWQTVTVSWEPPTDQGTYPITNYLAQAIVVGGTPGNVCITRLTDAKLTECTFTSLRPGVQYTFRVQGLNGGGWGARSEPSNIATPYDLRVTSSGRKKLSFLKIPLGSEVSAKGTSLGYPAGTRINVFIKEGDSGQWVEQSNSGLTSDASGNFSWKRKFSPNKDRTPISVQFGIGPDRSNIVRLGPVK